MSSETTNTGGQPAEAEPFKEWLMRRATERGYDMRPGGGGRSALARAADVSPAQIGRALEGQAVPSTDTLRALAKPLGVPFVEMLFRAGVLVIEDIMELIGEFRDAASKTKTEAFDFSRYPASWSTASPDATPEEIVAELGVTDPADQAVVLAMVERLRTRDVAPKRSHGQRDVGRPPRQAPEPPEQ